MISKAWKEFSRPKEQGAFLKGAGSIFEIAGKGAGSILVLQGRAAF
jgi:hypothetical protein